MFSEKFACPVSGFTIAEIEPRLFSFNNPFGACPACDGLGTELRFDADLVVPDEDTDPAARARSRPGRRSTSPYYTQTLEALARHYGFSIDDPGEDCPRRRRQAILLRHRRGEDHLPSTTTALRNYKTTKTFEGVIPNLERRWRETDSAWVREELARYQSATPCEPATATA